jgi:hypothetical protein
MGLTALTTKTLASASKATRTCEWLQFWAVTKPKATNFHYLTLNSHYHHFYLIFRFCFLSHQTNHKIFSLPLLNSRETQTLKLQGVIQVNPSHLHPIFISALVLLNNQVCLFLLCYHSLHSSNPRVEEFC